MKVFNSIGLGSSGNSCQGCAHFQNDPVMIEKAYPGLTTMSSGFASVRDKDGLCNYNQLYLSARDSCKNFKPRMNEFNYEKT
jgi:hypothetical protein